MEKKILFLIFSIGFFLYLPSLFNFYSHDDFFNLKLAQVTSAGDFLNFFNLWHAPAGFGHYRPLTTQVYFSISYLFNKNPMVLHLLSFLAYFLVIFLVFNLTKLLTKNSSISLTAAFLYALSATHFGHLYYLSAFQELGLASFYLSSVIFYIRYLKEKKTSWLIATYLCLVGGLLCKEFAVTMPLAWVWVYLFIRRSSKDHPKISVPLFLTSFLTLGGYLYLHVFKYGLATGDSYIWDFSLKFLNTLVWYGAWTLNIPEMFVDFVGPGVHLNPNLLTYYGQFAAPILVLFLLLLCIIVGSVLFLLVKKNKDLVWVSIFSLGWFVISLLPVLFLPWHKFTYELTVPLFATVFFLSWIIYQLPKRTAMILTPLILLVFTVMSITTNLLTHRTHWITQGGLAASVADKKIVEAKQHNPQLDRVVFYDSPEDAGLPWKPSELMKNILSDNNYFSVFQQGIIGEYREQSPQPVPNSFSIKAREVLKY